MKHTTLSSSRKTYVGCMKALMYLCAGLTGALVLFLVGYVLVKGLPNITWELLSTKPSYLADRIGILPDILNTLYIIIYTLILVLPLGVGAAIYLTEYAANKRLVGIIEYAAETLSGPGQIVAVYGLCILALTIWGFIYLLRRARHFVLFPAPEELPRRQCRRAAYLNAGMIVFLLLSLVMFVLALGVLTLTG